MTRRGILFVSHGASRTGAPIALLRFLRWFKKNGNRTFSILLPSDGELTSEYAELGETWALDRSRWCPGGTRRTVLRVTGLGDWASRAETREAQRFAARCSPGLVYVNSIASAPAVDVLSPKAPLLTHVHELEFGFRRTVGPALSRLLANTRQFIACSHAVKDNLVLRQGVPPEQIETVHASISVGEIRPQRSREQVLDELGIRDNALLVAGAGTPDWRKGPDLFLQLARTVSRQRPTAYFVWVGGGWSPDPEQFKHDIRQAGLAEKVSFTGWVRKPNDYLAAADVFALTSREDPYPLVCLEAAALGKPIVCFSDAGGMPEFVERDCGFVVPYLDIEAMAQRVICLLDSPGCRLKIGEAARRKVTERHDISAAGPQIMKIIERTIGGG